MSRTIQDIIRSRVLLLIRVGIVLDELNFESSHRGADYDDKSNASGQAEANSGAHCLPVRFRVRASAAHRLLARLVQWESRCTR